MSYIEKLTQIGLTEKEAKVYLAGLELGPTKASLLQKSTGIQRTNVYALLEKLIERGMFRVQYAGFKKVYVASPPQVLEQLMADKARNLTEGLTRDYVNYRDITSNQLGYYKGVAGMRSAFSSMLEGLRPGDWYYVFGETVRLVEADSSFFKKFFLARAKYKLDLRLLLTDDEASREYRGLQNLYASDTRILPQSYSVDVNMVLNPYRVLFHKLTKPHATIVIESKEMAAMQKQVFETLWSAFGDRLI